MISLFVGWAEIVSNISTYWLHVTAIIFCITTVLIFAYSIYEYLNSYRVFLDSGTSSPPVFAGGSNAEDIISGMWALAFLSCLWIILFAALPLIIIIGVGWITFRFSLKYVHGILERQLIARKSLAVLLTSPNPNVRKLAEKYNKEKKK